METRRSIRNRLPARAILVLTSSFLTLAMLEGAVRLLPSFSASPPPPRGKQPPDPRLEGLPILRSLRDIAGPNIRGVRAGKFFRTNSAGIRGPEYSADPPSGVFRIAITGDSVTMGAGVDEADAYPAQLERMLNEGESERRFQVLNVGLGGLPINPAIFRLERVVKVYRVDLIVYGFTINDIEGPSYRVPASSSPRRELGRRRGRFARSRSHLLRVVWPRLTAFRENLWPTPGTYLHTVRYNYFDNPAAWTDFASGLDRFANLAEALGVCDHVLIHAYPGELGWLHPFRSIYEKVGRAAEKRGITVTDSFPFHAGARDSDLKLSATDPHPNERGHELLARALLTGLEALPASCWEPRHGER